VTNWKDSLARGLLPTDDTEWPDETFRAALLETLKELDMARFTRKVRNLTASQQRCWEAGHCTGVDGLSPLG